MKTSRTSNAALSATRTIRIAWLDEKLDAEARGDAAAAERAMLQLTECDRKILELERRDGARFAGYAGQRKSAFGRLWTRVQG